MRATHAEEMEGAHKVYSRRFETDALADRSHCHHRGLPARHASLNFLLTRASRNTRLHQYNVNRGSGPHVNLSQGKEDLAVSGSIHL